MDLIEKSIELINLYDRYQGLLTSKQKMYFEQYYFDDFSITEISENQDVSRNAVHDLIKRTIQKLYDYEEKLGLYQQAKEQQKILDELEQHVDEVGQNLIEQLRKVE
jgi:predicted DNA-binding protein YlxM (UPF0122 family)